MRRAQFRALLVQSGLLKVQKVYRWKPRLSSRQYLRPFWFSDETTVLSYRIDYKLSAIKKDIRDWWYGW